MSYPPPYPPQSYGYGYPAYGPPPDHPQTTTVLVLGILGVLLCQVIAPFAWVMGKRALNEIDSSGGAIGGRGNVIAGYICGIVGTCILLLGLVAFVLALALPFVIGGVPAA